MRDVHTPHKSTILKPPAATMTSHTGTSRGTVHASVNIGALCLSEGGSTLAVAYRDTPAHGYDRC